MRDNFAFAIDVDLDSLEQLGRVSTVFLIIDSDVNLNSSKPYGHLRPSLINGQLYLIFFLGVETTTLLGF